MGRKRLEGGRDDWPSRPQVPDEPLYPKPARTCGPLLRPLGFEGHAHVPILISAIVGG
jgi:hypothetical protein